MKKIISILLLSVSAAALWAQFEVDEDEIQYIPQAIIPVQAVTDEASNLQIAISNRDYSVTPGDVYTLTFLPAGRNSIKHPARGKRLHNKYDDIRQTECRRNEVL